MFKKLYMLTLISMVPALYSYRFKAKIPRSGNANPITTSGCCAKASKKFIFEDKAEILLRVNIYDAEKETDVYIPLNLFKNDDGSFKAVGDILKLTSYKGNDVELVLDDSFCPTHCYGVAGWYKDYRVGNRNKAAFVACAIL